jgi:hypothetical protein
MLVTTSRSKALLLGALLTAAVAVLFGAVNAEPAAAGSATPVAVCSGDSVACGDLATNGTCCAPADRCCLVPADVGDAYCVPAGAECRRYGDR